MKILIWLLCALVYGIIVTVFSFAGISLGGLPTVLIAGSLMAVAAALCNKVPSRTGLSLNFSHIKAFLQRYMELLSSAFASLFSKIAKHTSDNPQPASNPKTADSSVSPVASPTKSAPIQTSGSKKQPIVKWPVVVIVALSLLSLVLLSVIIYQHEHYRAEFAAQNVQMMELDGKLSEQSKTISEHASEISKLTDRADFFDAICNFLSSGNVGYSSSNFRTDESIIVVKESETDRKFTLTANWEGGASVSYSYDSALSVRPATISFDSSSWKTSTTVSITPKYEGTVIVTFKNDVNSETFKILIIVTK